MARSAAAAREGVREVALRLVAKPCPRAQVGRPGWLVLDHHEPFESGQISMRRMRLQHLIRAAGIGSQGGHVDGSGHIAPKGLQQATDPLGIASSTVQLGDSGAAHLCQIVSVGAHRLDGIAIQVARPAANAHPLGQVLDRQRRRSALRRHAAQELAKGNRAGGMAGLEQRHRAHGEAGEPPRAGVSSDVVGGHGRTGENELAGSAAVVHGPADAIPDGRFGLPFVDQARHVAVQHQGRIHSNRLAGVFVYVQQHLAGRHLPCSRGFSARSRPFDNHCTSSGEPFGQLLIDDARLIAHGVPRT